MQHYIRAIQTKRARKNHGFTLVELLVVIAIIGILASIVIPNVAGFLKKGQVTKAVAEIKSIDTALLGMLSDVGRSSFRDLLNDNVKADLDAQSAIIGNPTASQTDVLNAIGAVQSFYQDMFYNLLRQGKNSEWAKTYIKPDLRQKLGNSYMELGQDAWGQNYQFWMGPLRRGPMPFRSFRVLEGALDMDDLDFKYNPAAPNDLSQNDVYIYTSEQKNSENSKTPGAPKEDNLPGFPAPKDLPAYVYSHGNNQVVDAFFAVQSIYNQDDFAFYGGGDDINNWDNAQGWNNAPQ